MKILDIGFGLGYNVAMALFKTKNLKIVSLEKDILDLDIKVPEWFKESYEKVKQASRDLHYKDNNVEINIIS